MHGPVHRLAVLNESVDLQRALGVWGKSGIGRSWRGSSKNEFDPDTLYTHDILNQNFKYIYFFLSHVCLPACVYVALCIHSAHESQNSVRSSGTGITDHHELPCGCWEPISGSL